MTYSEFVEKNILSPLGADSSGFADRNFAPDSYAVLGNRPHEFPNVMGSGGVSTNIIDLCKFGQMFLSPGQGAISPESIKEMSSPQGKTFIPGDNLAPGYGLGWDSVEEGFAKYNFGPGVLAKSGGTDQFISQLYVIPQYNMVCAISATVDFAGNPPVVLGDIAAEVLRVQEIDVAKSVPAAMIAAEHEPLPEGFAAEYAGMYGAYSAVLRVAVHEDDTISTEFFSGTGYKINDAKLYFDGTVFVNESGEKVYKFMEAEGRKYMVGIKESHGLEYAMGQKLEAGPVQSAAWKARLGQTYLPVYVSPNAVQVMNSLALYEIDSLPGILIAGQGSSYNPMGILSDNATEMILQIPGALGRDLYTLRTKTVNGEEWLYNEYYDLRPVDKLTVLKSGTLAINQQGDNEFFQIPPGTLTFTVPDGSRVIAYDNASSPVYDSIVDGVEGFDKLPSEGYIQFIGDPGLSFTITVK